MQFRPKEIANVIDIGQTSVKLLQIRQGKKSEIRFASYDLAQEGFVDAGELYGESGIVKWLREMQMERQPLAVTISQELCTTKVVNELPPNASNEQLQMMLATETSNLAGLSGEEFAFDFQKMKPVYSAVNPVLIGYCRKQLIEEREQELNNIGIFLSNAAMSGTAMVNALLYLHPEVEKSMEPQIVLDIGKESSICAVILAGNILSTCTLLAGTDACTQGVTPLLNELSNAIDNWKSSELQDIADHYIDGIWLCGEAEKIPGITQKLHESCNCTVFIFGPQLNNKMPAPEFAAAYGLALQELGLARYTMSLAPEEVVWRRIREDRFGILAAACILLFLFIFISLGIICFRLKMETLEMQDSIICLKKCNSIIPQLDEAIGNIEHLQLQMSPVVELGNRSKLYMRALEELSSAFAPTDWCIYFSDQFSHKEYGTSQDSETKDKAKRQPRKENLFGAEAVKEEKPGDESFQRINVSEMRMLTYLVIGGYTMAHQEALKNNEKYKGRYGAVLKIEENLLHKNSEQREENLFGNVDWLNENKEWTGREAQISLPWNAYLKNNKNFFYDYTEFKLKLVLAKRSIAAK